jgi:aryl-alcohol dehydrogenase-like predicted oxidoreductase
MRHRGFGRTGVQVGEIGLGCWQIGGSWGDVAEDAALETLRAALETGVNFLDTADVYGDGRSERLIGRFLRESADKPFVATKLGRGGDPGWPGNFTLESIAPAREGLAGTPRSRAPGSCPAPLHPDRRAAAR